MRYALGVAAAIIAGLAFNVGLLIQKAAVGRAPRDRPLMRSLLKSPVWISGFALQFILGTPLYTLSVGLIGPAIVPGLMSIGLIVLASGAVLVQKERLALKEIVGIVLVVLAVALFGFTRLSIDVHAVSMKDPVDSSRGPDYSRGAARNRTRMRGGRATADRGRGQSTLPRVWSPPPRSTRARGGVVQPWQPGARLHHRGAGPFRSRNIDPGEIAVFLAAVSLTVAGNMYGIVATQHALVLGRAAVAIPLQNAVTQVLPVFVFFLVYHPYVPSAESLAFLGAAGVLLLTGIVLLTGRLAARS